MAKTASFDEVSTDLESLAESRLEFDEDEDSLSVGLISKIQNAPEEFKTPWCMANRVALWVGLLAIAALLLGRHELADMHVNGETILMNILFQVGADLGSTVDNVLHGTVGTFWAVFTIFMLRGFFPDGYVGTNPEVFWIGVATLAIYILLFMFLNIRASVRFFALITYIGYAMSFLEPVANGRLFSTGFELSWKGAEVNSFSLYLIAGIISIGVMLMPCPQPNTALRKSQDIVKTVSADLRELQVALCQYYFGVEASLQVHDIQCQFETLHDKLDHAASFHSASWFESFGMSTSRLLIKDLIEMLDRTVKLYQPLLPIVAREDFSKDHQKGMYYIEEPLSQVMQKTSTLLGTCTVCALDGRIDRGERRLMENAIGDIAPNVETLQKTLRQTGQNKMSKSNLGLLHFVYTASAAADEAKDHASQLLTKEARPEAASSLVTSKCRALFEVTTDDLWWALRTSISLGIALVFGYIGLCNESEDPTADKSQLACFVEPYNANLASIQIILMSKLTGSTFKSALNRVSAVMIVSVSGQFLYVTFGWCATWARLLTGLCVFLVVQIGMFMAYHGGDNSEIGTRLAAIGVSYLMSPCSSTVNTYHSYSNGYHELSDAIIGVFIMMAVDMVLGDIPSSQRAKAMMVQAISDYKDVFDDYVMGSETGQATCDKVAAIIDQIAAAKSVGEDALNEPTTWHGRLSGPFFAEINTSMMSLSVQLLNLATEINEDKDVLLDALPSYGRTANQLVNAMDYTAMLLTGLLSSSGSRKDDMAKLMALPSISGGLKGIDQLIKEANEAPTNRSNTIGTMHLSVRSRRSVVVLSLETIMHTLHDLQRHAIRKR